MMKTLGMALMAAMIGFTACAQDDRGSGHHGRHGDHKPPTEEEVKAKLTEAAAELGLNESQTQQFIALQMEGFAQRRAAMEERKEERKEMHEEMQAKREAHEAKLKEILTAEQFAKWQEMHKEHGPRGGKGKGHRGHEGEEDGGK